MVNNKLLNITLKTVKKRTPKKIDTEAWEKKQSKWVWSTFLYSIKVSGKTIKCDNIEVNKKEFHDSK